MVQEDNTTTKKLERMAEILKTIAHPVRLNILEVLQKEDSLSVSELMQRTNIEQSLLSHHLIKMKTQGVLVSERDGKNINYSLSDINITNIFECMNKCNFL